MISPNEAVGALRAYGPPAGQGAQRTRAADAPGSTAGLQSLGSPSNVGPSGGAAAVGMQRLLAQLHALPDVRSDRVGQVSQQIAAGTYPPSGRDVATKMLTRWLADQR